MARVELALVAKEDLDRIVESHGLPGDAGARVEASLRGLELFPRLGRELGGRWRGCRYILGPWPWMILVYSFEEAADTATVIAIQDGRSSSAATPAIQR